MTFAPLPPQLILTTGPRRVQRWLGAVLLTGCLLLTLTLAGQELVEQYAARHSTAGERARAAAMAGYLATDPSLQPYQPLITQIDVTRVAIPGEPLSYQLELRTTLTADTPRERWHAEGAYARFWQFVITEHPELGLSRVIILDASGVYLTGGQA